MQIVSGYKGTADIRLAAESGEIGGLCWGWEVMKAQWSKALDSGDARVLIQALPKAEADLPKVPVAIELAKTEEAKNLIQIGIHDQSAISALCFTARHAERNCQGHAASISRHDEGFAIFGPNERSEAWD